MGNVRYWLPGDGQEAMSAKLLYVSSAIYEGDWCSIRHSHNFSELFYVLSGQGRFIVENETFPVKQDDLVIVNPNIEHTEVSVGNEPLEYIVLGVEGMSFDFGDRNGYSEHAIINNRKQRDELLFYFNKMLYETENKQANYEVVCQNLLEVVLINLMRASGHPFSVVTAEKANKVCGRIKRYMDSNYAEDISLDALAEKEHISKYYLVRTFAKHFGMSPIHYLNEVRTRASKELLVSTDLSISQIAQSTGFSSQSYFSQSFRRSCGITPRDYRRETKQQG